MHSGPVTAGLALQVNGIICNAAMILEYFLQIFWFRIKSLTRSPEPWPPVDPGQSFDHTVQPPVVHEMSLSLLQLCRLPNSNNVQKCCHNTADEFFFKLFVNANILVSFSCSRSWRKLASLDLLVHMCVFFSFWLFSCWLFTAEICSSGSHGRKIKRGWFHESVSRSERSWEGFWSTAVSHYVT